MPAYKITLTLILCAWLLSACSPALTPIPPTGEPTSAPITAPTLAFTATALPSSIPTATETPLPTKTQTPTPAPTDTPTITPAPTYISKLHGEVIVDQAVCHYGPGKPYLYKYGVIKGSNLEIIGRDERGIYIEVQAIGGNNPCWVKAEYMKVKGDVMSLAPIDARDVLLPMSPYYGAIPNVVVKRNGNEVTVSWPPLVLKAGDDSLQVPYLIEAWACKDGQILFTPLGFYQNTGTIADEPGCLPPSHARLYGVEKHGYTKWLEIPWPPAQ